ncbi:MULTISPECIES: hypothetical protein [unclassified Streptomyces]|uniref:hypothetical protein n=1 Tax=unclassified Streptomyces TaxID=2593676 RepID=UPI0033EF30C4
MALVDVAAVADRDEEAAALPAVRSEHQCSDVPWCCRGLDRDTAIGLLATIRERQGRIAEAIALLRAGAPRCSTAMNNWPRYWPGTAGSPNFGQPRRLTNHGTPYNGSRGCWRTVATWRGAIAAYRMPDGLVAHDPNLAFDLAQLLTRHGRENEAIDVMRVQAAARNSA